MEARKGGAGGVCEGDNKQYEIKVKEQEKLLFAQAVKHTCANTQVQCICVLI